MQLLAINLQVCCTDGTMHENIKLCVENNQRVYLTADGDELKDVESVNQCTAVVPPTVLATALHACKECE